ncbi:MAG: ribonuclease D [Lonepinella koalarum]|nr:ribonuclease D [Lonepinella koalarum]
MRKEDHNLPHFQLVTDNQALAECCQQAMIKSAVALDTEFVRIRTYYPKLGLIQLYDGERLSLIIPDNISDFSPFVALLAAPFVEKILHSCSEDLAVFKHYFGQLPTPMKDTQIIADFLGFPNSTGFATLVKHYFQLELDKGASRTDWLARPLSEQQLSYAAADVWYLLPLYLKMNEELAKTRWKSAVDFDCELLLEKQNKIKPAEKAYLTIPQVWLLSPKELNRLKWLAEWRHNEAILRDLALNFVVKSDALREAAKHYPKNRSELLTLGFHDHEVRIHGKKILWLLEQAEKTAEADYPQPIEKISENPNYKKTIKTLQQRLQEIAPNDLSKEVIASKRDLEDLLKWVWLKKKNPEKLPILLRHWRAEFGQKLMQLID